MWRTRERVGKKFSKVLYAVTLYAKHTRALNFQNFCQEMGVKALLLSVLEASRQGYPVALGVDAGNEFSQVLT